MEYTVRKIRESEYGVLEDFLYLAVFVPDGVEPPPREIVFRPELRVYTEGFGKRDGDLCLVAETGERIVGAVWTRIMNDYGHIDGETPSMAVSVVPEFRNKGIGTALMRAMMALLKEEGFRRVSLSVQKANYARRMYEALGFVTVAEKAEECIMENELCCG